MNKESRIYIAGHNGLVGSAIYRALDGQGHVNLICRERSDLDLSRQSAVNAFFRSERPEYVFLAAAKAGGIWANNTYPAEFIYDNLLIQTHVIHAAWTAGVRRLLFFGSSCIYPGNCPQPMKEEYLLTGPLEATNEPYAVAKIAGIKMCQSYNRQYGTKFLSVMPTNLYGPNDNFDLETSHVLPALIHRFHLAKRDERPEVTIWGTGEPRREFLHVDDLADACVTIMNLDDRTYDALLAKTGAPIINIGFGKDISIVALAQLVSEFVGYGGRIRFDTTKPNGVARKLMDISKLTDIGWQPKITLKEGIERTYDWCLRRGVF